MATARRPDDLCGLEGIDCLPLDVTSEASVTRAVEKAGEIDVLVNNGGVSIWGPVESVSQRDVDLIFSTNLFGMLRLVRAVLPGMRARRTGQIYQMSSVGAKRARALLGHYAATKAALEAYSEALRLEVAPFNIAVCIVVLGAVESRIGANRRDIITPPYRTMADNVMKRINGGRECAPSAESVCEALADLIDNGNPPLRFAGTDDVVETAAWRASLSDEEWEAETLQAIWGQGLTT